MIRLYASRSARCVIYAMVALAACGKPPADGLPIPARVDALFAGYSSGVQPGLAVAVIRDGIVLHRGSYGYADIDKQTPITDDTAFRLASVSKQFAAMAIMLLAEDGLLAYDDPIGRFLPELSVYEGVTIRQLLLHTGGLPDYYDVMDTSAGMPTNRDAVRLLAEIARADFPAGEKYAYSNAGYDMLGPIVEAASGISFREFVEQRIFAPLDMKNSRVHDDTLPAIPNRATGYEPEGVGFKLNDYDPLNAIIGSGGIYSTINDLIKWDRALYDESFVSRETLALAFTSGTDNQGRLLGYGFGWGIDEFAGHKRLRHGGSWVGFRTHIARVPELHFTIIVLSNRADAEPGDSVDALTQLYLGQSDPQPVEQR